MAGGGADTQAQVPDDRPNIIFFLTDDMDEKLLDYMPLIQARLGNHGVKFNNAFVTLPLCCPSRATVLTGQYAHNHNVVTNVAPAGGEPKFRELGLDPSTIAGDESTAALWLQSSGYKTGLVGKYLNDYQDEYVPPGWTDWRASIGNGGGTNGNTLNENGRIRTYDRYPTDLYRAKALGFIRNANEPFFLWVGFQAPHAPARPAIRHAGMFKHLRLQRSPGFNERDVSDKPLWVQSLPRLTADDVRKLTRFQRNRVRSLQAVDEAVASIMGLLKQQGELDNTYIVFTSDNGLSMGEHRWTKKVDPYEESIGVPLLVRGPGVEKGVVRDHMVTNNDFAPTFARWGQADVPDFVDGKSFDGLLGTAPPAPADWRKAILIERLHQPAWTEGTPSRPDQDMPPYVAVRTENEMYVKYKSGEKELYDLDRDPYELTSQHATEPTTKYDIWLEALQDCAGADCRTAEESEPPDTTAPDTTITEGPTNPSSTGSASFSFAGTDDMTLSSDLAFQCRLDSQDEAAFAACSNPQTYSDLAGGSHTFEVRAADEAGNVDATPATYTWTIEPPP